MNSFKYDMKESLPKALVSGVTFAAGSAIVFPQDITATIRLPVIGANVPFMAVLFAGGVIGSISGDLAASMLYPMIPAEQRIKNGTTALVDAAISGAVSSLALGLSTPIPMSNMGKLYTFSVAHNMANEFLYSNIIAKDGFKIL